VLEDVDDARMDDLVDNIMFGVFIGNGQACSATTAAGGGATAPFKRPPPSARARSLL
jgi:hypothetical protein